MEVLGLFWVPNWLLYVLVIFIILYYYYTWHFGFLEKYGIPGPKPYPVLGNNNYIFKYGFPNMQSTIMKEYGKVSGIYIGRLPAIIMGDVNVLRRVMIKEFSNFENRMTMDARGVVAKSLFDARGEQWRHLRHLMTPAFTTGKLKQMMSLIDLCANRFVDNMVEKSRTKEEFEAKELTGAFTMDTIANTAFGLDVDSQKNKDDQFVQKAKTLLSLQFTSPVLLVLMLCPFMAPVFNYLDISMFPHKCISFFSKVVKSTLKLRRQGEGVRVDFLQMMLEAEKNAEEADEEVKADLKATGLTSLSRKKKDLSEDDILAQCILFFGAGYDTTATTMSFLMYNLATHPEIQERLAKEIKDAIGDKADVTREDLGNLTYLDMCLNETLRLFPPVVSVEREAASSFEYNGVMIPANTIVMAPIRALQRDPDIWPEPEKFDPERFTPEAKASRDPMYFMPFGVGPRQCIGMRLAQLEMKLAMAKVLRRFKLTLSPKTQVPIRLSNSVLTNPEGGIWLRAEERTPQ